MKTSRVIKLFALLGILVIANPEPAQAQKPEEQFQKGLIKEEAILEKGTGLKNGQLFRKEY